MDKGAGDEEAARFAGRQFVEPAVREVPRFEPSHGLGGGRFHFRCYVVVGPDADGAEKSRQNEFAAGDVASALSHEVVGDEAEVGPKVKDIPIGGAQDAERCFGAEERVAFASDGFDEC